MLAKLGEDAEVMRPITRTVASDSCLSISRLISGVRIGLDAMKNPLEVLFEMDPLEARSTGKN